MARSSPASTLFDDPHWGQKFPPILTVAQAAELLQVPKQTVYDWSSRKLLPGCTTRVGKYRRFIRDKLIEHFFNQEKLNGK